MDTKVSKNDKAGDNSVQNVTENDAVRSTDNVAICIECDAKTSIVNDPSQLNDTVLEMPLPRAERVKRTTKRGRKGDLFGFYNSENLGNSRLTWVQSMIVGEMLPSEGPPLEYDPESRNDFVRKVLFILTLMMLFTFLIVITIYVTPLKPIFAQYGVFFAILAAIMVMGLSYAFSCSHCTRNPPCNYICLLLTVISMSIICAFVTMRYDTEIIIYALLATVIAVAICTLLALTKFDFTSWILYVVIIVLALSAVSMILAIAKIAFGFYMKPLHIAILIAGLIMNCIMLVIELQMVLGGKSVELSEDDYALGAFMLYMSIIEMFLHFIKLIGLLSED